MNEQTCTKCGWTGMVEKCLKCGGAMEVAESPKAVTEPKAIVVPKPPQLLRRK